MSIFGTIGKIIGIGGSIYGAAKSGSAAKEAAAAQLASTEKAIAEQRRQFDITQSNLQPFLRRGNVAGHRLSSILFGSTKFDPNSIPGFTEALDQGLKSTERSAFAQGQGLSGRTLASLFNQAQGASYNAFNNYANQLAGVAGTGQTAGTNLGTFGSNNSSTIGNLLTQGGNARASGIIGANNALQQGINNTIGPLTDLLGGNKYSPYPGYN